MKKIIPILLIVSIFMSCAGSFTVFAEPADGEETALWITDKEPVKEYAYSFAVIGDIQTITYHYPEKLSCIYDWLVENAEAKKIKFAFGLGDITDMNLNSEWAAAKKEMQKLDTAIPYSIVRGNHDSMDQFITFFPYEEYADRISGSFGKNMLNTYQKFNVGKIKYLVMNLDVSAKDDILSWADEIIAKHPDHNVIITTHIYSHRNSRHVEDISSTKTFYTNDGNNGKALWEKLIKNHKNIVLVLSGHIPNDEIVVRQEQGIHGNIVTEMLVDPQYVDRDRGASGLVAMLYFSEDGKNVQVEYYSTVRDAYFLEQNQFSLELDVVEPKDKTVLTVAIIAGSVLLLAVLAIVFRKKIFQRQANGDS